MHLYSIMLLGVWACIQCIATVRARYNYPLSSTRHCITKSFVRPLRAGLRSNEYSSFEEHTGSQSVPSEGSSDVKYDRGRRALSLPVDIIGFLPIPAPAPMPAPATVPVLSTSISTSPSDNPPDTMTKIRRGRKRGNTADFIARAVEIHGDQYDYSLSEYGKTSNDKVVIQCTRHEPPLRFEQSPAKHLSGQGCRVCGTARSNQKRRGNTADFIARAVEIHSDQYDYSLSEYGKTNKDKVVIQCTRHERLVAFEQSPNTHFSGRGCPACARSRWRQIGNTADFIARAVEIHGDQYDYSLSKYGKTCHDKVVILCTRHDPPLRFEQRPDNHLSGSGCPACGTARLRSNTADFIARAVEIHGDQYDYSLSEYGKTKNDKVAILCTRHDPPLRFEQSPNNHLSGQGCPACGIARRSQKRRGNTADFIARAVEIHGDQYDYSLSEYGKTNHDKVVIQCTRHDPPLRFEQSPNHHLSGQGCRACGTARQIRDKEETQLTS
jgi:hypothetical protein